MLGGILKWLFASKSGIIVLLVVALGGVSWYARTQHIKAEGIEASTKLVYEQAAKKANKAAAQSLQEKLNEQATRYENLLESERRAAQELQQANDQLNAKLQLSKEKLEDVYEHSKEARDWRDTYIPDGVINSLQRESYTSCHASNRDTRSRAVRVHSTRVAYALPECEQKNTPDERGIVRSVARVESGRV